MKLTGVGDEHEGSDLDPVLSCQNANDSVIFAGDIEKGGWNARCQIVRRLYHLCQSENK